MDHRHRLFWIVVLLGSSAVIGCRPDEEEPPPRPAAPGVTPAEGVLPPADQTGGPSETPVQQEQREERGEPAGPKRPVIPEVLFTEADRHACRVFVGDLLPDAKLADTSGTTRSLSDLLGEEPAVVLLWAVGDEPFADLKAVGVLSDLENEVQVPYGQQGVRVVAVNVANSPDVVRQCAVEAGVTFPVLVDEEGSYFAQLATGQLPRIYLLDSHRKILWLDREFSATTRRQLAEAIQATLATSPSTAEAGEGQPPGPPPGDAP